MVGRISVRETQEDKKWRTGIKDDVTGNRIDSRVFRLQTGLLGETRPVGGGVSELKLNFGPGYRIYFAQKGNEIVLLLQGGDKSSQPRDISAARAIWEQWKDNL